MSTGVGVVSGEDAVQPYLHVALVNDSDAAVGQFVATNQILGLTEIFSCKWQGMVLCCL